MPDIHFTTRQELFAFFDAHGIKTTTVNHIPVFTVEDARKVHDDILGGHCKNLFCKDEKGVLWLIIALEDTVIDLKAAKDLIGSRRLSFGKPELLMQVLGVTPGSVTPFSLINDKAALVNVILEASMMRHALLNFHPLKNDATTTISSGDLITFIRATGHEPRIVALNQPV